MSEPKPLTAGRCCYEPLDDTGLENLRYIYQGILDMEHGRDGKENTIRVLFATIDARDAEIARLAKIEERAEEVLREREDSTAAYILEGGTRHVGKPDARKGLISATPSPTIAVTDDDVKEALDEYDDYAELNTRETNMRAALENFAYRKGCPTIAAPSPSNADRCAAPNCGLTEQAHFVVNHIFVPPQQNNYETLEAALKARKPADDGAGQ